MRPGQQNKRSRGRSSSGRKNVNPLSRNYESNGPDVKVRGSATHIAEKYVQLARDAQSSGDFVMGENYFQHAEHYFRIISAAQAQNQARQERRDRDDQDRSDDQPAEDGASESGKDHEFSDENAETDDENVSEKAANDEDGQDKPKRAPRARRPRRKPTGDSDLADAPQPKLSGGDDGAKQDTPAPDKKTAAAE